MTAFPFPADIVLLSAFHTVTVTLSYMPKPVAYKLRRSRFPLVTMPSRGPRRPPVRPFQADGRSGHSAFVQLQRPRDPPSDRDDCFRPRLHALLAAVLLLLPLPHPHRLTPIATGRLGPATLAS